MKLRLFFAGLASGVILSFTLAWSMAYLSQFKTSPSVLPFPTPSPWFTQSNQPTGTEITITKPIYVHFFIPNDYNVEQTQPERSIDFVSRGCLVGKKQVNYSCDSFRLLIGPAHVPYGSEENLKTNILSYFSVNQCNLIYPEEFKRTTLFDKQVYKGVALKNPCPVVFKKPFEMTSFIDIVPSSDSFSYYLVIPELANDPISHQVLTTLTYSTYPPSTPSAIKTPQTPPDL